MNKRDVEARIQHIRWNLDENQRRLAEGKIGRKKYIEIEKDGKRAISELRKVLT